VTTVAGRAEQLQAAYAHCAAIAARHGKSYHLATRLLTADRRPAVHALYAAARTADDLVDHPGADPAGDLADWSRAVLADLDAGWSDDPVRLALVDTFGRYGIPVEHLVDFLAAMTSDLEVTGYADMAALDRYMWGSAAVIGLQVLPVLGTAPGVALEEAAPHAIALGEAFQLTNFLRDVGEDADRGRVYLPADLLAAHGVTREQLAEKRHDARFAALMREMVAVVRRDRASRLPGARPAGVGVQAAPPGRVRPPVDRGPAGQGQGDHREAEEQVLDRGVGDPQAPDRVGVVGDDAAPGQHAVHQQLEDDHDRVGGPEHRAGHQPRAVDGQVDDEDGHDGEDGERRVGHRSASSAG
jgi:phytoene synthase